MPKLFLVFKVLVIILIYIHKFKHIPTEHYLPSDNVNLLILV